VVKSYKGRGNEIFTIDIFMKVSFSWCLKDLRFQLMFRGVLCKILCNCTASCTGICQIIKSIFPFSISNNFETKFKKLLCCGVFCKIICDIELYKNLTVGNPQSSPPCVLMERDCIVFGPEEEEGKISSLIFLLQFCLSCNNHLTIVFKQKRCSFLFVF
jgi:hypothetical protein